MNIESFRAQLEGELTWRTQEVLFFQNQCEKLDSAEEKDRFRRALILLLYSNFEGYCIFGFSLYISAINEAQLDCKDANYSLVAATLHDVFVTLRGVKKAKEFKNTDPDDSRLHLFARERDFVEHSSEIFKRKVLISDDVVDTESNLGPVVLKKNLFKLGLPYTEFEEYEKEIDQLLKLRNKIAHGETKQGISVELYEKIRTSAFKIMSGITTNLTNAIGNQVYLLEKRSSTICI